MMIYHWQPTQLGQQHDSGIGQIIQSGSVPLLIFTVVVVGPLLEELIFRVGLMSILFKGSPFGLDILLSSSLFALAHMIELPLHWIDFLFYALIGACLGIIYRTSQSIWYAVIAHSIWNFLSFMGLITFIMKYDFWWLTALSKGNRLNIIICLRRRSIATNFDKRRAWAFPSSSFVVFRKSLRQKWLPLYTKKATVLKPLLFALKR